MILIANFDLVFKYKIHKKTKNADKKRKIQKSCRNYGKIAKIRIDGKTIKKIVV